MATKSSSSKSSSNKSGTNNKKSSSTTKKSSTQKKIDSFMNDPVKYTNKEVKKDFKKASKKHPVATTLVILGVVALVGGAIAGAGYLGFIGSSLSLNGKQNITLSTGSEYKEEGSKFTYFFGQDKSNLVTVKYYADEKKTEEIPAISTENKGKFYATYSVKYQQYSETLTRNITIADTAPLSINVMTLGNDEAGDSIYIKAGETDILIDCGSTESSVNTIYNYINQPGRCEDNKLEFAIATHADQDHIAGYAGSKTNPSILERMECDTFIKFAKSNKTTQVYKTFENQMDKLKTKGSNVYTAYECAKNLNGAKNIYDIAPGTTMEILYQKFYEEKTNDENNYSVCLLFTQGSQHYLLTGDLEKEGEASLVENNNLPHCEFFKANHHGSYTANSIKLLDTIQPETVAISCVAGSDQYTKTDANKFPAQAAISNIGLYTDRVFVTSEAIVNEDKETIGFKDMNGVITFYSETGNGYEFHGSNNDINLKDTEWFTKNNRTWPIK